MPYTIYKATAPNGKAYVGCTRRSMEQRWTEHYRYMRQWPGEEHAQIGDAIGRYGKWKFTLELLAVVEDAGDAAAIETLMIERHGTARPNGYNWMRTSHYVAHRWRPERAA